MLFISLVFLLRSILLFGFNIDLKLEVKVFILYVSYYLFNNEIFQIYMYHILLSIFHIN